MISQEYHKIFVGATSIATLIIGLFLGAALASKLGSLYLQVIIIGLVFTNIILLLIIETFLLEVREILQFQKKVKKMFKLR